MKTVEEVAAKQIKFIISKLGKISLASEMRDPHELPFSDAIRTSVIEYVEALITQPISEVIGSLNSVYSSLAERWKMELYDTFSGCETKADITKRLGVMPDQELRELMTNLGCGLGDLEGCVAELMSINI